MKKIKIFLDSNVFIAGVASATGASAVILRLMKTKVVDSYVSQQILEESERNLKKKLPKFLPFFYYALKYLPLKIIRDSRKTNKKIAKVFPKKSDFVIFQTVQELKPDFFLTLNRKHFHEEAIRKIANFKICTPAQFLDEWKEIKISDFNSQNF